MTREDEIRQMLKDLFRRYAERLSGHRVVLFGSRAGGNPRPRSDFDLAVVGDSPLPRKDFYALADELDELPMLSSVDWVDLARCSHAFKQAALANAEVLHAS